jgi:hypothetical protein
MTYEIDFRNRLNQEFITESDRGCAILTVCLLEETLHDVFAKVLPKGKESARDFMPPGRLALGVRNAAALGLLSEPELSNIKLILKIRNAFAHKLLNGLKFDSPEIKNYTLEFTLPNLDGVTTAHRLKTQRTVYARIRICNRRTRPYRSYSKSFSYIQLTSFLYG